MERVKSESWEPAAWNDPSVLTPVPVATAWLVVAEVS
jgi:hypothetical protein